MKIGHTRAMIRAALAGVLDSASYQTDSVFNLAVPTACPGVPSTVLTPRTTWKDPLAYDEQARRLAHMFAENFKAFAADAAPDVKAAGPRAI
jgi:phosphoenolpyruvate carboxykinase (ATP)